MLFWVTIWGRNLRIATVGSQSKSTSCRTGKLDRLGNDAPRFPFHFYVYLVWTPISRQTGRDLTAQSNTVNGLLVLKKTSALY